MSTFGKRMRETRNSENLTLGELSKKLKTTPATLSRYENDMRVPDIYMAEKIANALNVSPSYLLGWESFNENLIQIQLRGIEYWSNDQFFSQEEREAIKMHFADLLIRYKDLINTASNSKHSMDEFIENYSKYNDTLTEPLTESQIKDLFWSERLDDITRDLNTWINVFTKYLSGVYKVSR